MMNNKNTGDIKGHFWVELADGRKIDPYFKYYDALKWAKNLGGENIYRELDMDTQRENINKTIIPYMIAIRKSKNEYVKQLIKAIADQGECVDKTTLKFEPGCCHINAIINKMIYGKDARIVYGDLGWKKNGTNKIYYEYEHAWNSGESAGYDVEDMIKRLILRPDYFKLIMGTHKKTNLIDKFNL